ncbi:MAG: Uncharacterised protein [Owenweeksia sp. TMED14]|nr:MAG: Uncharacterised protein [Owenweeksia sp. TMED14]
MQPFTFFHGARLCTFVDTTVKKTKIPYRDPFGYPIWVKRIVIFLFGIIVWYRCNYINKLKIKGGFNLKKLPSKNVLFVSNHQTYFMDAAALILVFCHVKNKIHDRSDKFWPLALPKLNVFFIAAKETMKSGILPRLLALAGSVSIKRTWREAGINVKRNADQKDIKNIKSAIRLGWVITFPQGSTKPFIKGRRGTAHLIKELNPTVVPVVINGFRRAFDKKGLRTKKRGTELNIEFKKPLVFSPEDNNQQIMDKIMDEIEQAPNYKAFRKFNVPNKITQE